MQYLFIYLTLPNTLDRTRNWHVDNKHGQPQLIKTKSSQCWLNQLLNQLEWIESARKQYLRLLYLFRMMRQSLPVQKNKRCGVFLPKSYEMVLQNP